MLAKEDFFTLVRYYNRKVRNFLSRAQSKELLTFLFFLCLSFLFWMLQSMNEESEATYTIPISYRNIPEDVILTNNPPSHLNIRLRDKGIILLNYSLGRRFMPVDIDVESYITKDCGKISLSENAIYSLIKKQINVTSTLLSLAPDTLNIFFSKQGEKTVPVYFNGTVIPKNQFHIAGDIRLFPDSVRVYAPRAILDTLQYVMTAPVMFNNISDSLIHKIALNIGDGMKIVPSLVTVSVPIEEYTEKVLNLPIEIIGMPLHQTLRIFPSSVQLSCFVLLRNFKNITSESFQVAVDYNEISEQKGNRIAVEILHMPDNVFNVHCQPDSVEFIIEENE